MRRARAYRRSLSDDEQARFDEVFDHYRFLNLDAGTHFRGFLSAITAVGVWRARKALRDAGVSFVDGQFKDRTHYSGEIWL